MVDLHATLPVRHRTVSVRRHLHNLRRRLDKNWQLAGWARQNCRLPAVVMGSPGPARVMDKKEWLAAVGELPVDLVKLAEPARLAVARSWNAVIMPRRARPALRVRYR